MYKIFTTLCIAFLLVNTSNAQTIDSLTLSAKEIPKEYTLTTQNNCISIQACTFYDNPGMYEMMIGKVKQKQIQNFDSPTDKGSIMYFEFEKDFKADAFLAPLLWGGKKPTTEHPETYYIQGHFLIIWSFKKGSKITEISKHKTEQILH